MHVDELQTAIELANSSAFGLTGGIHTLDPTEVETWTNQIEVGNGYVNRPITGAIVQRQPFGGWKRSSIGPGAKAGGPNYVQQLGVWNDTEPGADDYATAWADHFNIDHDPTGLFCEANVFRYRPLEQVGVWFGAGATERDRTLVERSFTVVGTAPVHPDDSESLGEFAARVGELGVERVRVVGHRPTESEYRHAVDTAVHFATAPVSRFGRVELLHLVREQAISRTLHRFGNLIG
jgi:RHH-type proline utilization regulon transcriptional repressor/proline dehydrogenase/delta 1-pyrroline-5-carboxylate dehydrogenase